MNHIHQPFKRAGLIMLFGLFVMATFTGCPDYSKQRDKPDYQNMDDTGPEAGMESPEKK